MAIAKNVILIWTGTNATIPSGYTRETSLDGYFPKGTADVTEPNTTGGSTTHTHTSPSHSDHTITAHTHLITFAAYTGSNVDSGSSDTGGADNPHNHAPINSGAVANASVGAVAATYGAVTENSLPPYHKVIFIKSAGNRNVPPNVIALYGNATVPTNWVFCDGTSGTPDLRNKYLYGAGTGADAGATGGALTHSHVLEHGAGHTTSHTHAQVTSGYVNTLLNDDRGGSDMIPWEHTHTVDLTAASVTTSDNPTVATSETVEPAYTKLLAIQNQNVGDSLPVGIIGLWLGTLNTIPSGWVLCDGTNGTIDMRSRHLKIANADTEADDTGGSNTHIHTGNTHVHALNHSNHGATVSGHSNSVAHDGNSQGGQRADAPTHSVTIGTATINTGNGTTSADSSNNEPIYRTVAFIKLVNPGSAAILLKMI